MENVELAQLDKAYEERMYPWDDYTPINSTRVNRHLFNLPQFRKYLYDLFGERIGCPEILGMPSESQKIKFVGENYIPIHPHESNSLGSCTSLILIKDFEAYKRAIANKETMYKTFWEDFNKLIQSKGTIFCLHGYIESENYYEVPEMRKSTNLWESNKAKDHPAYTCEYKGKRIPLRHEVFERDKRIVGVDELIDKLDKCEEKVELYRDELGHSKSSDPAYCSIPFC